MFSCEKLGGKYLERNSMSILKRLIGRFVQLCRIPRKETQFTWEDTIKIKNGMTNYEVISILGDPHTQAQFDNSYVLIWSYTTIWGAGKAVSYKFENDCVASVKSAGK